MTMASRSATLNNGRSMPLLGLGTWKSGPGEVEAAVKLALHLGYRHIDCAAAYCNETEVGKGIKAACHEYNINREDVFVTSKLWNTKHHAEDVEPACRETLAKLGLEYLDLYLIHWPYAFKRGDELFPKNEDGTMQYDFDVHPTDTWLAMEKLVDKGLVRSIGVSNFNAAQIQDIISKGKIKPVTNQVESHPYLPQTKLMEFCAQHGIVLTAYSPLGSPDRPWATKDEPTLLEDPKIAEIAKRIGKSPAQILLRWQVQRNVSAIPKSVNASRITENWNIWDFSLGAEDMATLGAMHRADGRYVAVTRDVTHKHYPFGAEF